MAVSTYQETLEYLYSQLPMFSRIGASAYKKDLGNTLFLCNHIGNPQTKFKSVHVAGTNGKGSVSHFLASIFQEAGFKTGLYTSPHIHDFRERIRVNGQMIDTEFVVDFVSSMKSFSESIQPSFFELTVAMAFKFFEEEKVDIAIIETGLGGRLDSTNVIHPELSVITNIGYDHINMLGDTLGKIAFEKAGIIKKGSPAVIGQLLPETKNIFQEKAEQMHSPLVFAEDKWKYLSHHKNNFTFINKEEGKTHTYYSGLAGLYQQFNIPTVLAAVEEMKTLGWNIEEKNIQKGMQEVVLNTGIRGRWQKIEEHPDIILDVAHNEDGIKQVLRQLKEEYPRSNWHFIMGFVNDKPLDKILSLLPKDQHYYFTKAHISRALETKELCILAAGFGITGKEYDHVNLALNAAKLNAGQSDVIVICGSFFIIAELP